MGVTVVPLETPVIDSSFRFKSQSNCDARSRLSGFGLQRNGYDGCLAMTYQYTSG